MKIFQFTKKPLVDAYTAFIRNVKRADDAIKIARTTKPAFDRFLQVTKQNKNKEKNVFKGNFQDMRQEREIRKLSLTDLLAKPFQRIPRYRLLLKVSHSDNRISLFTLYCNKMKKIIKLFRDFWSTQIKATKIISFSGRQRKKSTSSPSGCQLSRKKVTSRR